MFSRIVAAVLIAASTLVASYAAEPIGTFDVAGSNPGNRGRYSGTVTVERTGDTFRVTWDVGRQTFVGTGIGTDKGIASAAEALPIRTRASGTAQPSGVGSSGRPTRSPTVRRSDVPRTRIPPGDPPTFSMATTTNASSTARRT